LRYTHSRSLRIASEGESFVALACRWMKVDAPTASGFAPEDSGVHKMVMNIGNRPTVNQGDEEPSVEVHGMHRFAQDFYGQVTLLK